MDMVVLTELPGKAGKTRQKKQRGLTPPSRPRPVQPPLPDEPFADYAEQDVIAAIETVVRATTKAMDGDI